MSAVSDSLSLPKPTVYSIGHVGAILSVGVFVLLVLWHHTFRVPETGLGDALYASMIARAGIPVHRAALEIDLLSPDNPLGQERRVLHTLPVGSEFAVELTGGLVSRVGHRRHGSSGDYALAYAFHVPYTATIERNDGRCVVETRHYGAVRMAKLVAPVDEMTIDVPVTGSFPWDEIPTPPGPGIRVAPVERVASAILATGYEQVRAAPASRAFVAADPLSDKTVTLTYRDGQGVVTLSTLANEIPTPQVASLFVQPILSDCYLIPHVTDPAAPPHPVPFGQLNGMLDPTLMTTARGDMLVTPLKHHTAPVTEFELTSPAYWRDDQPLTNSGGMAEYVRIGQFHYDPAVRRITQARLELEVRDLQRSREGLLFETEFRGPAKLVINYSCRLVQ